MIRGIRILLSAVGILVASVAAYSQHTGATETRGRSSSQSSAQQVGTAQQLRSQDHVVETYVLRPGSIPADKLLSMVREHWSLLRAKNLAAATPVLILLDDTVPGKAAIQYSFRWRDQASRDQGRGDPEIDALMRRIQAGSETIFSSAAANQAFQGFDYAKFPDTGGVELLGGRCDSEIKLSNVSEPVRVSVANGFVLMHRSPGRDRETQGNGSREMFVQILQHGGDVNPRFLQGGQIGGVRVLRVEQNVDRPQYGLIRANSPGKDFPATAMWVVHWKIITSIGTLVTDPNTPLVFGPAQVEHYPPVGTEFFSKTGPVNLILEKTGQVVGTLTPKELTAFDIVVTKDDEIPSVLLNEVPSELVQMFNKRTAPTPQ